MNLGSPDSTNVADVKRYLTEFLMDKRVIDSPYLTRLLLVRGIIVPFRSPKSAKAYESVWMKEGSPLIVFSQQLQDALALEIEEPVKIAMRYGTPSPKDAFDALVTENPDLEDVLLIPLYPHYAMSSYETAAEYGKAIHRKYKYRFRLTVQEPYYNDQDYIRSLAESIRPHLSNSFDHILFSYHGVPERHIYKGDITGNHCLRSANCCQTDSPAHAFCYRHQCFVTTGLAAAELGLSKEQYSQSFQSRLGRAEWLKPYTAVRLAELPKEGVKRLLVVCPAFVSDCLETLEEIAVEGKHIFIANGGTSFQMIPCLNTHPLWVQSLARWIENWKNIEQGTTAAGGAGKE